MAGMVEMVPSNMPVFLAFTLHTYSEMGMLESQACIPWICMTFLHMLVPNSRTSTSFKLVAHSLSSVFPQPDMEPTDE